MEWATDFFWGCETIDKVIREGFNALSVICDFMYIYSDKRIEHDDMILCVYLEKKSTQTLWFMCIFRQKY